MTNAERTGCIRRYRLAVLLANEPRLPIKKIAARMGIGESHAVSDLDHLVTIDVLMRSAEGKYVVIEPLAYAS